MATTAARLEVKEDIDKTHRSFTSLRSKAKARRQAGTPLRVPAAEAASSSASSTTLPTTPCTTTATSLRPPLLVEARRPKNWLVQVEPMQKTTPSSTKPQEVKGSANMQDSAMKNKRVDQPPEHHHRRGNKRLALQIACDERLLEEAEDAYRREMTSEGDTSTYNLITWVELHTAYGRTKKYDPWPTFPLTPTKIHGVGALLKGAAYRSPKNYLQVAKKHHILAGHPWSDQLKLAADQFRASTLRGMGPPAAERTDRLHYCRQD